MSSNESRGRIFIAEDNPALLQGLERALIAHGFDVETAGNGPEMLELLESTTESPDLLLVDIMMPRMSGFEVAAAVRRHNRYADVPVVLITAATQEMFPQQAKNAGANDLLTKPFRLDELLERIEIYLGGNKDDRTGSARRYHPPGDPLVA